MRNHGLTILRNSAFADGRIGAALRSRRAMKKCLCQRSRVSVRGKGRGGGAEQPEAPRPAQQVAD